MQDHPAEVADSTSSRKASARSGSIIVDFWLLSARKIILHFTRARVVVPNNSVVLKAMVAPHLSGLLASQSDFGHPAGADVGYNRFGLSQNLACGADRSHYTRRVATAVLCLRWHSIGTEEADDAEGHRQVVQFNQGLRIHQTGEW
jgi:hypothetical protein